MQLLKDSSVAEALGLLFHGKCAFCEAFVETMPYRFRPSAEARPFVASETGHLYYAWLADAWENIYPICNNCHPSEVDYFPVKGSRAPLPTDRQVDQYVREGIGLWRDHPPQERALLLDPCGRSELYGHFHVGIRGGFRPRTEASSATIEHFRLNEIPLIEARRATYAGRIHELIAMLEHSEPDRRTSDLFAFAEIEFGGSWFLLLRRLAKALQTLGAPPMSASRNGIAAGFLRLYGRPGIEKLLHAAVNKIFEEDDAGFPVEHKAASLPRRSRTRLTNVRVRNFRSIESLEFAMPSLGPETNAGTASSTPSVLILGENAAGKSSLLEAIALAFADPAMRAALKLPINQLPLDPRYMGAGSDHPLRNAEITLTLDGRWSHKLTIFEDGYRDQSEPDVAMPPVFAYGAFRHYIDRRRKHGPAKYIQSLFHPDQLLSNPERWLLGLDDTRFDMVVRALRDIFSIEGEFDVIQRTSEAKRCVIVTRMFRPDGSFVDVSTPLGIVSSGFRSVLAMVCDIFEGLMDPRIYDGFETLAAARAVVLIDEVEAHLHPRWKMQIMRGLRTALPNVTFIATTHDPLCLRGMDDHEVRVMQKVSSSQANQRTDLPIVVEQLREIPSVSQLTLEQLLTSNLFQLFSTDTPETDATLAMIGDLLARQRADQPLTAVERSTIDRFNADITSALPVGSSEVHRLVQNAVVEYLRERRAASEDRLRELSEAARQSIVGALRGI
ncbi:AAA family ATPase [Bradyrhizobium sp. CCBAU 45389]|uniref:AAA family ATPase n=1 Tax=Bradyrhizobium sp. CCBAU 45389 TaxID=858429 RepID=UPI002305A8F5|nr:AAA family ATPase [Bradyrhizobium sp. CCBAU 45389]